MPKAESRFRFNQRQLLFIKSLMVAGMLVGLLAAGLLLSDARITTNLDIRHLPPSWEYPFGTDWLGRDMLARTVKGLNLSLGVGLLAASLSGLIALVLGLAAGTLGKAVDTFVMWLVDLALGLPHLLVIILIAFAMGGGAKGVITGVVLTHWPSLTRVIRGEVLVLRSAEYVLVSRQLGKSRWWVATRHILPHILPQLFVGVLLLFPHAVLHEAAVTFLGFGLSPHQPAIGVILSESMSYLSTGKWWLAFFPGLLLLLAVRMIDVLGHSLHQLADPHTAHL